ncbi:hypothetical protein GGR56DRAFT_471370 [Xylariaceae sp. FL0804]|nr:hypothetical protein GGR56DRAFT_471370 [Xylariaceae sp. FL0804]
MQMSRNGSTSALMGFSVHQPAIGAPLQFFPAMGSQLLDDLINAYVPGSASISDKRAAVSMMFFEHSLATGELYKFFMVYPSLGSSASAATSPVSSGCDSSSSFTTSSPDVSGRRSHRGSISVSSSPGGAKAASSSSSASASASASDFSHLPGMKILTRDGVDVTHAASRGSKTKEQRDHAHLMRILKACDACRRKKTKCDPSHRRTPAASTSGRVAKKTKAAWAAPGPPQMAAKQATFSTTQADQTVVEPSLSYSFDSMFTAAGMASTADYASTTAWDQFIQYDDEPIDSIPVDYDFFLDPAGFFSPTYSSTSSWHSPSQPITPEQQLYDSGLLSNPVADLRDPVVLSDSALQNVPLTRKTARERTPAGLGDVLGLAETAAAGLQRDPTLRTAAGLQNAPVLQTTAGLQNAPRLQTAAGLQNAPRLRTAAGLQNAPVLQTAVGLQHAPLLQTAAGLQNAQASPASSAQSSSGQASGAMILASASFGNSTVGAPEPAPIPPYLNPGGVSGNDYADFVLYSPVSTESLDEELDLFEEAAARPRPNYAQYMSTRTQDWCKPRVDRQLEARRPAQPAQPNSIEMTAGVPSTTLQSQLEARRPAQPAQPNSVVLTAGVPSATPQSQLEAARSCLTTALAWGVGMASLALSGQPWICVWILAIVAHHLRQRRYPAPCPDRLESSPSNASTQNVITMPCRIIESVKSGLAAATTGFARLRSSFSPRFLHTTAPASPCNWMHGMCRRPLCV